MALALAGVIRDDRRLIWGAIALMSAAIIIRIIASRQGPTS
jgi:hypothetical protein